MKIPVFKYIIIVLPIILCLNLHALSGSIDRNAPGAGVSDDGLLEEISRAAFLYFIREADPESGLVRDKTGVEYSSVASVGFGPAALPVGAERGLLNRCAPRASGVLFSDFVHILPTLRFRIFSEVTMPNRGLRG